MPYKAVPVGAACYRGNDKIIGPAVELPQIQGNNIPGLVFFQKDAQSLYRFLLFRDTGRAEIRNLGLRGPRIRALHEISFL
jgi:hypothetical protein